MGRDVRFITGTDEHGLKMDQTARREGRETIDLANEMSGYFREMAAKLNLSCDDFVRTTQPRHKAVVQAMLNKLHAQGDIYKAPYRGWYSWKEETFLTEKDRRPDGTFAYLGTRPPRKADLAVRFKHLSHAFAVLAFVESTPDAFARARMVVDGDIASGVR